MAQAVAALPDSFGRVTCNPTIGRQRAAIERAIETLIALVDEMDGDIDLEMDDHWGTVEGERPVYRIDQSTGPVRQVGL